MAAIVRFSVTVALFFLIDCSGMSTAYSMYFCLNRAYFYALIVGKKPLYQILVAGFFALIPTFLRSGIWGADLVCMIPLAIALTYIARVTHMPFFFKTLLVVVALFVHALIIDILWI
jgi:hypothetical protein